MISKHDATDLCLRYNSYLEEEMKKYEGERESYPGLHVACARDDARCRLLQDIIAIANSPSG